LQSVVQVDAAQAVVVVVFGAGVGGKPTAAAGLGSESSVDVVVDEAGTWGENDASPGTLEENYRMGMP
jgi:hypothetical protein